MTYKERLTIEHPDNVDSRFEGGCSGCPINYGYVAPGKNLCREFDGDCEKCWNSEMPETENYILKGEKEMKKTKKELLEEIAELKKEVERADQALKILNNMIKAAGGMN